MPIDPRIAALVPEMRALRRDFHAHPELLYAVERTAGIIARKLSEFGCDAVETGIGQTGVCGVIRGASPETGRVIALRAEMDALPIHEETNLAHASTIPGRMHACGHDGHAAMLLGAAKHLAATRAFEGTIVVIFQPAEEGGAGAKAMIEDRFLERFAISEVYGMHNLPGLAAGHFALRAGPLMAATTNFRITIEGRGAHAAKPNEGIDPVLVGAQLVTALQSIVSRTIDPIRSAVVSVTMFHAGEATNVIAPRAILGGTVRTLDDDVRELVEARFRAIVEGTVRAFGASAGLDYVRGYPATINPERETALAARIAAKVAGEDCVNTELSPIMGGEDFSYFLQSRPGAMIFIGNGDSAGLHHPGYDFNDAILPIGMQYWAELARESACA